MLIFTYELYQTMKIMMNRKLEEKNEGNKEGRKVVVEKEKKEGKVCWGEGER